MRAIQVSAYGGPEVLTSVDINLPIPAEGEIRIKIEWTGINFIDIYQRTGLYPLDLPFTPGMEASGIVDEVGPKVSNIEKGTRIVYAMVVGSYAEYAVIPAENAVKIPNSISTKFAAAVFLQGLTAHYLLNSTYKINQTSTILIHAAAGGVGQLLIQMAKLKGASVLATASSQKKIAIAKDLGADEVINYTEKNFSKEINKLTNGLGVDVVYDSVGKTTLEGSLKSLKSRGMLVSYGNSSGAVQNISPLTLSQNGSLYLTRPTLGDYIRTPNELQERSIDLFTWIIASKLNISIYKEFNLHDVGSAHKSLSERLTTGKLVASPNY